MTVSYANDSFFWVVSHFSDISPEQAYKCQTGMTGVMGITTIIMVFILSLFPHEYSCSEVNACIKGKAGVCLIGPGDIIVAESNFGCGSAREQAATALKYSGVGAVLCDRLARTFYRNAINNQLPAFSVEGISGFAKDGETLAVDLDSGVITNLTTGETLPFQKPSALVRRLLDIGAIAHYREKLKEAGR